LRKLDGLPLAIAQAAAYLQETGTGLEKYIQFYEQKWKELMVSRDWEEAPLLDYPDRSVWTTWTLSYDAIRDKNAAAANLLLLWAFLDSQDLWYGLFAEAYNASTAVASSLSEWIGDIASNELEFTKAIGLLRNYSLIESVQDQGSYATHPVVHRWAYYLQGGNDSKAHLAQLAVMVVGWAIPRSSLREYFILQRRILPHAQVCTQRVRTIETKPGSIQQGGVIEVKLSEDQVVIGAVHNLGLLYQDQGKLVEAEQMYERALHGFNEVLGPKHTSTLMTVGNLGIVYEALGKLNEAEQEYMRALQGYEEELGPKHMFTLKMVGNLGSIYMKQGRHGEAEQKLLRALEGYKEDLGPKHKLTLQAINNLGVLHADQDKLGEAEQEYMQALRGFEDILGIKHTSTLQTVNNLGVLYGDQDKLGEAEQMYNRALQGYEEVLGSKHTLTLQTVNNLGILYRKQGKLGKAEQMYVQALQGYQDALGPENVERYIPALNAMSNLGNLFADGGKLAEAEQMYQRALQGYEKALGPEHTSTLLTINNLGKLYHGRCYELVKKFALQKLRFYSGSMEDSNPTPDILQLINLCVRYKSCRTTLLIFLCSVLQWMSEDTLSLLAFSYGISGAIPQYNKICDGCRCDISESTGYFSCKSCKDVDLCGPCFARYGVDELKDIMVACQDHPFLDFSKTLPIEDAEQWLQELASDLKSRLIYREKK
jgi:tetratricopeptide (TPR) repeat protein